MWFVVVLAGLLFQCSPCVPPSKLLEIQALIDREEWPDDTGARARLRYRKPTRSRRPLSVGLHSLPARAAETFAGRIRGRLQILGTGALDLAAMAGDAFLLGDYASADRWFSEAVRKDPGSAPVWYQLGRTRYNEKHFEQAVEALQHCLSLDPANAKAGDFLGLSYEGLGKTSEARGVPGRYVGRYDRTRALARYGNSAGGGRTPSGSASEASQSAATGSAKRAGPPGNREAYLLSNHPDLAQPELETAAALEPENAPVHFLLAQVYRKRGLVARADAETARFAALTGHIRRLRLLWKPRARSSNRARSRKRSSGKSLLARPAAIRRCAFFAG